MEGTGFQDLHPEISIRITTSMASVDFDRDDVDVAIRYGRGDWPGLRVDRLVREDIFPVCSPKLLDGPNPPVYNATIGTPAFPGPFNIDGSLNPVSIETLTLGAAAGSNVLNIASTLSVNQQTSVNAGGVLALVGQFALSALSLRAARYIPGRPGRNRQTRELLSFGGCLEDGGRDSSTSLSANRNWPVG